MKEVSNAPNFADWEVDFYSRPILESDGKKRWELLISTTQDFSGSKPFRWEKSVPQMKLILYGLAQL